MYILPYVHHDCQVLIAFWCLICYFLPMRTHNVRPNLLPLLHKMEEVNNRRYKWAELGRMMGVSRQAAHALFMAEDITDDSFMKYGTAGALLDLFNNEGLDITIADLFTVTTADDQT